MRTLPRAALAGAVALILWATLWPNPAGVELRSFSCIYCGERATADALANVILFAPFGAPIGWAFPNVRGVWRFGLALSLAVEFAQIAIPGRDPSLGDLIMNAWGAQIGAWGWRIILTTRTQGAHRALAPAAFAGFAAVNMASGYLLAAAPTTAAYYGQWTPNLGHLEWYRGRVIDATLNGTALRPGLLIANDDVRVFVQDSGRLVVNAVAGPRTSRVASLFSVYDGDRQEILLVGPDRDALVLRVRRHAAEWGLDHPDLRLERAFSAVTPGDTVNVGVERKDRAACLRAGDTHACYPMATAGRGWSLLYYPDLIPHPLGSVLDAVWLAALACPVGFGVQSRTGALAALGAVGLTLMVVTPAIGMTATVADVAASAAGLGLGALGRRRSR